MSDRTQERLDAAETVAEAMLMVAAEARRVPCDDGAKQDALNLFATNLDHYIARSSQGWVR